MTGFLTMLKVNMKLLLRNKGYLCFLILLPLFSILLLNIQVSSSFNLDDLDYYSIHEMENGTRTPLNMTNDKLNVMVSDSDQSYLSDFILQQLANTGSYQFYRYRTDITDADTAAALATDFANRNTIAAVLYIPPNLAENIHMDSTVSALYLFEASEDGRIPMLAEGLDTVLNSLVIYQGLAKNDSNIFKTIVDNISERKLEKESVSLSLNDEMHLNTLQQHQQSNVGYSLAIVSIAFLFSGVFIGSIVIEERHNLVFTRILLTNISITNYGLVKLLLSFLTTAIQIVVMGIGIALFVKVDFGLSLGSYLFFIFGIGIIFNLLSVIAGVLADNLLSSSYLAFAVWTVSAMLSGLYFPLDATSIWWNRLALLMPPHWVIRCSKMVMLGQGGAYSTFLLIVFAFIAIILSVGFLGIKAKK